MTNRINWKGAPAPDRYKKHEAYLWGALSHCAPERKISPPLHPELMTEYFIGADLARQGYIRMALDADPTEIVRRLKRDHKLKREERAARALAGAA